MSDHENEAGGPRRGYVFGRLGEEALDEPDYEVPTGESMENVTTKTCPRCGQLLFADMDTCYGCLYSFSRNQGVRQLDSALPHLEEVLMPVQGEAGPPGERGKGHEEKEGKPDPAGPVRGRAVVSEPRVRLWVRTADLDVSVPVPEGGLLVGREPSCDVVLHSPAVSRAQARVLPHERGVVISDLGATNPTLFRGRPVDRRTVVPFGEAAICCSAYLVPQRAE